MGRKVYQFGLRPPTSNVDLVRAQLRAAHEYRNDLVAVERGRRHALRAVDATDEVREAEEVVKASTKKDRKIAVTKLRAARKAARDAAPEELARIQLLDETIRRDARAITPTFWGTYLTIEAAHQQARSAPLYGDDAVTPSDPRFVRWHSGINDGQIGIQLQGGIATADVLRGTDTRVRLAMRDKGYGALSMRVGSDGRAPVWAEWPIKMHRCVPDSAKWKWVRVSVRGEGTREQWTVEITVDDSAAPARSLDRDLSGVLALEWEWSKLDDESIRVARWVDDRGGSGEVLLPTSIAVGIRKPDGIRAVRDVILNDLRPKLARAIKESRDGAPRWLAEAANVMHLWKSPSRFYDLVHRWRRERCDAARAAYEMLDAWWLRDVHLYDYESGARREACRERRDFYRVLAARWSREYRSALLSDQDLSREARFGDESDVRFTASIYELRDALKNAFGDDAVMSRWRDGADEDERSWCERAIAAWSTEGARDTRMFVELKEKTENAWAARKAKKAVKESEDGGARKPSCNIAE